jgi:hypothetical protein
VLLSADIRTAQGDLIFSGRLQAMEAKVRSNYQHHQDLRTSHLARTRTGAIDRDLESKSSHRRVTGATKTDGMTDIKTQVGAVLTKISMQDCRLRGGKAT